MDLLVITPSRGRPERLAEMAAAVRATSYLDTDVVAAVDTDDPRYRDYALLANSGVPVVAGPRGSLAAWTNTLAYRYAHSDSPPRYLASLGDDHIPRTPGWDEQLIKVIEAMDGPGWAYGNDLLQGENLPTAWVQSTELVRALGWMALPGCEHLFIDDAVRDLGRAAGRITYHSGVVIEHMHPAAGKAAEDDTYRAGNSQQRVNEDGAAYRKWVAEGLERDAATVRALTYDRSRAGMFEAGQKLVESLARGTRP